MGLVIRFPDVWRNARTATAPGDAASVIILPVVRIEREAETATELRNARPSMRRRKRPASRA
jgi:hypothetical protein